MNGFPVDFWGTAGDSLIIKIIHPRWSFDCSDDRSRYIQEISVAEIRAVHESAEGSSCRAVVDGLTAALSCFPKNEFPGSYRFTKEEIARKRFFVSDREGGTTGSMGEGGTTGSMEEFVFGRAGPLAVWGPAGLLALVTRDLDQGAEGGALVVWGSCQTTELLSGLTISLPSMGERRPSLAPTLLRRSYRGLSL